MITLTHTHTRARARTHGAHTHTILSNVTEIYIPLGNTKGYGWRMYILYIRRQFKKDNFWVKSW